MLNNPVSLVGYSRAESGTFTGNGAANRAIPHGLGAVPQYVGVYEYSVNTANTMFGIVYDTKQLSVAGSGDKVVTGWDATNFHVSQGVPEADLNNTADLYAWVAIG